MRQTFPAAADSDDFAVVFRTAVDHFFDDGVEAGNIASSGEDANSLMGHGLFYRTDRASMFCKMQFAGFAVDFAGQVRVPGLQLAGVQKLQEFHVATLLN